jgi:hypothetical protein
MLFLSLTVYCLDVIEREIEASCVSVGLAKPVFAAFAAWIQKEEIENEI